MIAVLLLAVLGAALFASLVVGLGRVWTLEVAFVRLGWIPTAATAVQLAAFPWLAERLSYAAAALPVLTAFVSLFATVMGMTLLGSARERGEVQTAVRRVTWIAALPGIALGAYLLVLAGGLLIRGAAG